MLVDEEACPRRLGTRARAWGQPLVVVVAHSRAHVLKRFEGAQASLQPSDIFSAIECGYGRGGSGLQSSTLLSEAGTMLDAMAGTGLLLLRMKGGTRH